MSADHFEIFVEEQSMEAFLMGLLPRLLDGKAGFAIHVYQGKNDLLTKLPDRLKGDIHWMPEPWRIVVVIDRDDDDCVVLKKHMEKIAANIPLRVINRIAVEELEAWYFGDWDAVRQVYPRVAASIPEKRPYRDVDAIVGGTWEAFERELQSAGYFNGGLRKLEIARELGKVVDPHGNRSLSFRFFRDALLNAFPAS
jgi:Domain of unknown function (DUF4276)